jgi:hypothetical protein
MRQCTVVDVTGVLVWSFVFLSLGLISIIPGSVDKNTEKSNTAMMQKQEDHDIMNA